MQLSLLGKGKAGMLGNMALAALGRTNLNGVNLGSITSYYTAAKSNLGLTGKNINDLSKKEREALNNAIERAKASVINLTTDAKGDTMSQQDVVTEVNSLASIYGIDPISTKQNFNLDVKIGRKIAEIDRARDKVRDRIRRRGLLDPQQGFDPDEQLGLESLSTAQQKGIQDVLSGKTAPSLSPSVETSTAGGVGVSGDLGGATGAGYGAGSEGTGGPGSTDMGEMTNKGSLITKRKASGKLKKKYMKRGGLASKK